MKTRLMITIALGLTALAAAALKPDESEDGHSSEKALADALHAVIAADRTVYTQEVVERLSAQEAIVKVSEHFRDDRAVPVPCQMLRLGGGLATDRNRSFSYVLLSLWPINQQNAPWTEVEASGLRLVAAHPEQSFYREEELGDERYLTAIYPDKGVSGSCISCHNEHPDSPRRDFTLGDVMGGIVLRVPLADP